jgi:hypothetical protein
MRRNERSSDTLAQVADPISAPAGEVHLERPTPCATSTLSPTMRDEVTPTREKIRQEIVL